jgi:hypothetical protein
MDRADLIDGLTDDILAYVMTGRISDRAVARGLKPESLDDRFEDFRLLVDLHFVLREDVVEFVRELPEQLRQLETRTHTRTRTTRGEVRGRVNWQQTLQRRSTESPGDQSLFVCDTRTEQYDTDENLVLKRLLATIHDTLGRAEEYLTGDYEWVTESWNGESGLIDEFRQIFERNVHVRRIRDPSQYEPTDRMLATALSSRHDLYRTAANLLDTHRRIHSLEEDAIRELIEQTAITPDDEARLFELFVMFRFIRTLDDILDGSFKLQTIESGRQEVARLEGDTEVAVYHDSSAPDRELSFRSVEEEKPREELSRTEAVHEEARRVAKAYFEKDFENQTGRPDVIVLEIDDGEKVRYLITEVKYSTREDTIRTGIKETLEYLAFLRDDGTFVFEDDDDPFGDGWNGLLVVQDLPDVEPPPLEDQEHIKILQASTVESQLTQVLQRIVRP